MQEFPALKKLGVVYLDTAATAQKPQVVIDAETDFYAKQYATVNRGVYRAAQTSTTLYRKARETVASFIGAIPEEVVFTSGTTESLNLLAHSLSPKRVALPEIEHHANIVPWQQTGAEIVVIPVDDRGILSLQALEECLQEGIDVVSIAHISNSLGTLHPIRKIADLAHRYGALLVVDGAQSAPYMPIDVKTLGADFFVFSGHKCYGPTGIGVLWGKGELLEKLPPYQTGGDMIEMVSFDKTTFQLPPARFEAGTPPVAQAIGLARALDYLMQKGLANIQDHEDRLLALATELLSNIPGLTIQGTAPDKGPILSFTVEGIHPLDLGTLLDIKGFAVRTGHLCAQPCMKRFGVSAMTRVSFGLYNTEQEIRDFAEALTAAISLLKRK